MTFGNKIKEIRNKLDLTQKEFALMLNTKQNTLSTYENCTSEPTSSLLLILFSKFNICPYWFFDLENPSNNRININKTLLEKANKEASTYGMSVENYIEHLIINDLKVSKN